jgi:hypothetical protein
MRIVFDNDMERSNVQEMISWALSAEDEMWDTIDEDNLETNNNLHTISDALEVFHTAAEEGVLADE